MFRPFSATRSISLVLSALVLLSNCAHNDATKQASSAATGTSTESHEGPQGREQAASQHTLISVAMGNGLGSQLTSGDRHRMRVAEYRAYTSRLGEPVIWSNPDSGNSGDITPVRDGHNDAGAYCREFELEVIVGGLRHKANGTACREPDGSWRLTQP